jgi:hypothetical protein
LIKALAENMDDFANAFVHYGDDLDLVVDYDFSDTGTYAPPASGTDDPGYFPW